MKKGMILLAVFFTLLNSVFAQSIQIDGVKGSRFTGVKPIISGDDGEVSGYYTYYMVDKAKKGIRTLQFSIIDKSVTKVVKTDIELHKFATLNTTVFNGKFFLVSWDDRKNKKSVFKVINTEGKVVKTKEFPSEKKRQVGSTVFPLNDGSGFYKLKAAVGDKGVGYSIEKIDNNLNRVWFTKRVPERGLKKCKDLVNSNGRIAVWEEIGKGAKIKPSIVCFDASTGKAIYNHDGYDGTSTILYNQLRVDKDGSLYAGGAYVDGEKYKSINNTGIYILKLDAAGKEVLYTKVSNKEKIQAALKANSEKGFTLGSKDKVFIEDLIIDGDEIVVISEMFRKNANMTPAAIQEARDIITGKFVGARTDNDKSKVVFEVMDFMLFKFNMKGELTNMEPIHKEDNNKITVWSPYTGYGGQDLAKIMSDLGWFDYGFTVTAENGKKYMVCSNNASPRKPEVMTYALDEGNAENKINLKNEGKIDLDKAKVSYFKSMRNTNTKFAVAYYQRKLKRITINIEDLFK